MPWLARLLGLCAVLLSSTTWADPVDEVEVLVMQRQFAQAEARLGAHPVAPEAPARLRALGAYLALMKGQQEDAVTQATALLESCAAGAEGCDDARDWARFVLLEAQDDASPNVLEKLHGCGARSP